MKKHSLIIGILILIIIVGAIWLFFQLPSSTNSPAIGDHIISMTSEGFSPEEITIKKGQTVTWVNNTSEFLWPASNLHPTHGIYPEFDPREPIAPGESWSFTFQKVGTWRYHDHLRPIERGVIEVVE